MYSLLYTRFKMISGLLNLYFLSRMHLKFSLPQKNSFPLNLNFLDNGTNFIISAIRYNCSEKDDSWSNGQKLAQFLDFNRKIPGVFKCIPTVKMP